ncbi:MAG: DUF192 domain-containing protein [Gracilimonas sp.]|nr:DUF192 domain-containing protein [Gracilimonas sp.]
MQDKIVLTYNLYMAFMTRLFTFFLLFVVYFMYGCGQSEEKTSENNTTSQGRSLTFTNEVNFINTSGEQVSTIRVAIADDNDERNQGLMDVNMLPEDAGMLFKFPNEEPRSFYMANTPLPLDIMFVNSDSIIIRIHHSTTPFSSKQLLSGGPAQYVVETNGGYAISNDIQEGMKIKF